MTAFHLLYNEETNRLVIHDNTLRGYEIQSTVRASCWIEAKKKLGFELTPLQSEMLDRKAA